MSSSNNRLGHLITRHDRRKQAVFDDGVFKLRRKIRKKNSTPAEPAKQPAMFTIWRLVSHRQTFPHQYSIECYNKSEARAMLKMGHGKLPIGLKFKNCGQVAPKAPTGPASLTGRD